MSVNPGEKIYGLYDDAGELRYVGVTKCSLSARLSGHVATAKSGSKRHCACWIRSLKHPPDIRLIEETDDRNREVYWIAHYRQLGYRLTNHTDGGDGISGYKYTDEDRKKISDSQKGKKKQPRTEAHRANLSKAITGKKLGPLSEEAKEKIRKATTGLKRGPQSEEHRRKLRITNYSNRPPVSDETRARLSQAIRESWARRKEAEGVPC